MKVLIKRPGELPAVQNIENTCEALRAAVDGYIETIKICSDLVVICDEEGRLKKKQFCCRFLGVDFVGPVVLCGANEYGFEDFPIDENDAKKLFPMLWEA